MHVATTTTTTAPQPTQRDRDEIIRGLETAWKATITLFSKTLDVTLDVGGHASVTAETRAGWGTYSMLAVFIGFLGAGPLYLTFTRDGDGS